MRVKTKYYGEQEIAESDLIVFPSGLPGFDEEHRFILQPFGEAFSILQSVDHAAIAFVVASPFLFFTDYALDLPDAFVQSLEIESPEDVAVWAIVSIQSPLPQSTVNLKAPVILNIRKNLGKQYIADHSTYSLRAHFIGESAEKGV